MEEEKVRQRARRKQRYLLEDFAEASGRARYVGHGNVALGALWMAVGIMFFGRFGSSLPLATVVLGVALAIALPRVNFRRPQVALSVGASYAGIVLASAALLGLPGRLFGALGESAGRKWVNVATLLNDLTPLLYLGIQLALGFLIYRTYVTARAAVGVQRDLIEELGR